MKLLLLASLEADIEKWIEKHCENETWPDAYIYGDLALDMAKAAELVFDASVKGQKFAEEQ